MVSFTDQKVAQIDEIEKNKSLGTSGCGVE